MADCTPGQGSRCEHAEGKQCTCQCGGANHGKAKLTPEQQAYAEKLKAATENHADAIRLGFLTPEAALEIDADAELLRQLQGMSPAQVESFHGELGRGLL